MAGVSTLSGRIAQGTRAATDADILVVDGIVKQFETQEGPLLAVDRVSLSVRPASFWR
jgi:hypothetical protein